MTLDEFVKEFEEILQVDRELTPEMRLEELEEWDSMTKLTLMSFARKKMGKRITTKDIISFETIQDIYDILKD